MLVSINTDYSSLRATIENIDKPQYIFSFTFYKRMTERKVLEVFQYYLNGLSMRFRAHLIAHIWIDLQPIRGERLHLHGTLTVEAIDKIDVPYFEMEAKAFWLDYGKQIRIEKYNKELIKNNKTQTGSNGWIGYSASGHQTYQKVIGCPKRKSACKNGNCQFGKHATC